MPLHRPFPRLAVLLAVGTLALSACGDSEEKVTKDDLEDEIFVATSVTGRDLVADSELRVTFDGNAMAITAGCNTLTSAWQLKGGTLSWASEPAQTMKACEPDLADQDAWLVELFSTGMKATETDEIDLVLTSGDVRLEFKESK